MAVDDSWTVIKPRSRKGKQNSNSSKPPPGAQTSASSPPSINPRTTNLRSAEEIHAEYLSIRSEWLTSEGCTKLRDLVKAQKGTVKEGSVSKAICLGVGTFDPEDGAWAQKRISFHQLIAFTVMVEELEILNGQEIPCVQQDPIFTSSDTEFLTNLGHKVIDSPAAYSQVSEDTFLYGVHLYRPVYAASLESRLPCIFVGTGYDEWESATMGGLDDIKPMKKMEDEYAKNAFPEDSIPATFYGTSIYWRSENEHADATTNADLITNPSSAPGPLPSDKHSPPVEDTLIERLAATKIT